MLSNDYVFTPWVVRIILDEITRGSVFLKFPIPRATASKQKIKSVFLCWKYDHNYSFDLQSVWRSARDLLSLTSEHFVPLIFILLPFLSNALRSPRVFEDTRGRTHTNGRTRAHTRRNVLTHKRMTEALGIIERDRGNFCRPWCWVDRMGTQSETIRNSSGVTLTDN